MSGAPTLKHWNLTEEIPRHMPILDRWLERAAQDRPLAGVTVLKIQHQLGNHVPQTQALLELGVAPQNLHWIDIPYTSTPAVREALLGLGIPLRTSSSATFGCWISTRPSSDRGCSTSCSSSSRIPRSGCSCWTTGPTCSRLSQACGDDGFPTWPSSSRPRGA